MSSRSSQVIGSVGRNRQDILPYYARLIGTLNPYMPDVGKDLIAVVGSLLFSLRPLCRRADFSMIQLDEEFRYLQRKRNVDLAETRSKVSFPDPLSTCSANAPLAYRICASSLNSPNSELRQFTLSSTSSRFSSTTFPVPTSTTSVLSSKDAVDSC